MQLDKGIYSETKRPSFSRIRPRYRRGLLSEAAIKRGLPARLGRAKNPLDHRSVSSGRAGAVSDYRPHSRRDALGLRSFRRTATVRPEPIGVYRVAERMLTCRFQRLIGKPGQSSTPVGKQLNCHANECAKVVLGLGKISLATHRTAIHAKAIVEAFPSSFLGLMIAEPQLFDAQRGNRSDIFYVHLARTGVLTRLISDLLPNRRLVDIFEAVTNHDDRAAVICALTSLCVAASRYSSVGDRQGWIILPPRDYIQPWAWSLLVENAETAREFVCEDTQRTR